MKKAILTFSSFLISILFTFAQNEGNAWYFGQNAGLDFNSGAPVPLTNGQLNTSEGCASIADKTTGSLLFYTDGTYVWDNTNNLMPNGSGLYGSFSATQSAVIVPMPGSTTQYYIFTVDAQAGLLTAPPVSWSGFGGLAYSIVDMTLNGGLGDITTKNTTLLTPTSEKIAAVRHCNGRDIWVVAHQWNSNSFYAYLVTPAGVSAPVISSTGITYQDVGSGSSWETIGYMKFSPDATKLASVCYIALNTLQVFDFDNSTGIISNPITDAAFPSHARQDGPYSVTFSPDNSRLYVGVSVSSFGRNGTIFQYNMLAGSGAAIIASKTLVASEPNVLMGALQIGPDGKVYVAQLESDNASDYLSVINNPNTLGAGCNYVLDQQNLGLTGTNQSLFGLPDIVETFLVSPYITTLIYPDCGGTINSAASFTDSLNGKITVSWNFGDPSSGASNTSTLQNPTHTFSGTGSYTITVLISNNCKTDTYTQTITVSGLSAAPVINHSANWDTLFVSPSTYNSYQWYKNSVIMPGQTGDTIVIGTDTSHYNVIVSVTNSCSNTATTAQSRLLPIELLSFNATYTGKVVDLNWSTASETNNDFFTVERTGDGIYFTPVANVKGAGNSSHLIYYSAVDENPLFGISAYRLKQTDFDGKYAYSRMVPVNIKTGGKLEVTTLYNDADQSLVRYLVFSPSGKPFNIEITDRIGRVVMTKISTESIGAIDFSAFAHGIYFFHVFDDSGSSVKRFVY